MESEITLSEARKITGELKASILKLEALNIEVSSNIDELQSLNQKMENYVNIIQKFAPQSEEQMATNYGAYLSFISTKLDILAQNSNLKRIEKIVKASDNITNFSLLKFSIIVIIGIGALISAKYYINF